MRNTAEQLDCIISRGRALRLRAQSKRCFSWRPSRPVLFCTLQFSAAATDYILVLFLTPTKFYHTHTRATLPANKGHRLLLPSFYEFLDRPQASLPTPVLDSAQKTFLDVPGRAGGATNARPPPHTVALGCGPHYESPIVFGIEKRAAAVRVARAGSPRDASVIVSVTKRHRSHGHTRSRTTRTSRGGGGNILFWRMS